MMSELIGSYTARGNCDPSTKKALPGTLEITRHIPSVGSAHTIERVATVKVVGLRDARKACNDAGAKPWDF